MTPTQFEEQVRQRYNAINDTFWSQSEIFGYLTDACMEAARECFLIERTYTSTTTSGVQEYAFPTNTIAIKRITWNGIRVDPIAMIEDDAVTGLNQGTTDTGTPIYYWQWNYTISLRPIPGDAQELKIWSYNLPSDITVASTIEIPPEFHFDLYSPVLRDMAAKDSNWSAAAEYEEKWEKSILKMKAWARKRKRTDGLTVVMSEEVVARGL